MLSLNLAALLALQQKKVLLVDADLRRPMLHQHLGLNAGSGLSSFLAGHGSDPTIIAASERVPGLHVLPAGPVPPYPAELLASDRMSSGLQRWKDHYDYIILDGPPALPVTDPVILSTLADFTLLVARYQVTERQSLERSYRKLEDQTGSGKVGVVLNAVRHGDDLYYGGDDYPDPVPAAEFHA